MNHIENTVSIVRVQQYLGHCMHIHCHRNPFIESLPRNECLSACCIPMAVLVVCFKVFAQQRVCMPQYGLLSWSSLVNCCWSTAAQSFLVLSPVGLVTIFYCLMTLGVMQQDSTLTVLALLVLLI
jgi:hypothetical protein